MTGVGIALDETVTREDLARLAGRCWVRTSTGAVAPAFRPSCCARITFFLQQAAFNQHHSEHEMLRYLKRLEDKDIALNRSMIPLGSCTMKLNATAEMIADHAGRVSPTSIRSRRRTRPTGYLTADPPAGRLAAARSPVSPRSRCSRMPARRANMPGCWRSARITNRAARQHRDVCLIPSSAHGTNPASAAMAGLKRGGGRLRPRRQHRSRRSAREGGAASLTGWRR